MFRPGPLLDAPIRSARDVNALRPFDLASDLDCVPQTLRLVLRELGGDLPLLGFAGAPMTLAFFVIEGHSPHLDCSHTRALMSQHPSMLHQLLERLADMTSDYLNMQIEAGVDAVQLFESAADLLSPREYAEFAQPYHVKILSRLGRRVPTILFAKNCPLVELMATSGADVLSIGSGTALAEAKERFGDRVAFQGNVDNRVLLSTNQDDIDEAVRTCIRNGGQQGHILNLGHGVLKDTPIDNVRRFIETAKATRLPTVREAVHTR